MRIEVEHVTKKYKDTLALDDVSFTLNEPKIYGLLGRNGAGKTTFMNILAGHQLATEGSIKINGENPFDNRYILQDICLVSEGNNFYKDMKVREVLKSYSLFYPNWDKSLADRLMRIYNLPAKSKVKALSKGMVSSLGVIAGLASKAPITIFDEPYIGMDAAARKKFYELLMDEMEDTPRTIIFSTHLIDEVSLLFEEVIIIQEGKILLQEHAEVLRKQTYAVTGNTDKVKDFIRNKKVLKTKQMANLMTAYIYEELQDEKQHDLTYEGIPIQDLMIYLTENAEEVS